MNLPELLAPAGNLSCALAAYDAGADAVYAGLKNFNARERTENFTAEEMSKLIAYAHRNSRKVYVTFNTLVKESECRSAAEALAELNELRPDAVIVQDLGVLRMIREYFPHLTIHASTQMGLHNSAGLVLAGELGAKRVILERQTTLDEIRQMTASRPPVELEVFIHGALCCCISGTCLLSSWLGGWSGNRGKCKQPCRRRHHSREGNGFFLSAQDLCAIDLLPDLVRCGVASFKIEGRLRRADYVSNAVAAYRMALDAARDPEEFKAVLPQAKEHLARTCGRKWSLGYYTPESRENLVKYDAMGVSGQLCGKVIGHADNGFTISASRRIHLGDTIRIQPPSGDEGPAICITRMSRDGQNIRRVLKGETCFIHSDKQVPRNAFVYKTGESTDDYSRRIESLPLQNPVLDLEITVSRTRITVNACGCMWNKDLDLAEAASHPLDPERIRQEFQFPSNDVYTAGNIAVHIKDNPFLPASVLKGIRKEFRQWLPDHVDPESLRGKSGECMKRFLRDYKALHHTPHAFPDTLLLTDGKAPAGRVHGSFVIAREAEYKPAAGEELVLPFFVPETMLSRVKNSIRAFYEKGGRTFRITSLHHLALLKGLKDIRIKTCMPLPVCNSMAVAELKAHHAELVQAWLELEKKELQLLAEKSPLPVEIYRYGRPALLSTRAKLPVRDSMSDARGNEFLIRRNGILTQVLSDKVMSIPAIPEADASFYDLRHAEVNEKKVSSFNFDFMLS